nr:MAG TPA: hypothetical protein [Caudoviricetes sp.]
MRWSGCRRLSPTTPLSGWCPLASSDGDRCLLSWPRTCIPKER